MGLRCSQKICWRAARAPSICAGRAVEWSAAGRSVHSRTSQLRIDQTRRHAYQLQCFPYNRVKSPPPANNSRLARQSDVRAGIEAAVMRAHGWAPRIRSYQSPTTWSIGYFRKHGRMQVQQRLEKNECFWSRWVKCFWICVMCRETFQRWNLTCRARSTETSEGRPRG